MKKLMLVILVVSIFIPGTAFAGDEVDQNGVCFCSGGIWPAKLSDGMTATDWRFMGDSGFPENRIIYQHEPIKIEYSKAEETTVTPQIGYLAPPGLSYVEKVRWGQALPTTRPYLARLWNISQEEAEKYGAKY